jgi:hypothetical protein
VPKEHAEVGARVVGLDKEAAVHVGVAARLVAEEPAHAIDLVGDRARRSRTEVPAISGTPAATIRISA